MKDKNLSKNENEEQMDEEIVFENDAEFAEKDPKQSLDKLRKKLKETEAEKQEYLDGWQRAKADFINSRKRDADLQADIIKFANENLISDIIPVLDSFDMAMQNKEAWEKAPKDWRVGVEYIYNQLLGVLTQNGLKQFNPIGQNFDPKLHEAVDTIETNDSGEDGKILEVLQKGYSLNEKQIRSAKVKTGKFVG
ncbi:MAG: nucleotide exchange factor GrpE [Candidatus Paceibacterota bacterium]